MTVSYQTYMEVKMEREIARKEAVLNYMKKQMSFNNGVARSENEEVLKVLRNVTKALW